MPLPPTSRPQKGDAVDLTPIIVAIITGPLMWGLWKFDKRNTAQHGQAVELMRQVKQDVRDVQRDVNKVDAKLDIHIADHGNSHGNR